MPLCRERFGWGQDKIDNLLLPVIRAYTDRSTQLRIDQFFTESQRFAKIRSRRLQQAVSQITGVEANPDLYYAEVRHLPQLPQHTSDEGGAAEQEAPAATAAVGAGADAAQARPSVDIASQHKPGAAAAAAVSGRSRGRGRGRKGVQQSSRDGGSGFAGRGRGRGSRGRGRAASGRGDGGPDSSRQEEEDVGSAESDLAFVRLMMQDAE